MSVACSIGTVAATTIALVILSSFAKWRLRLGKLRSRRPAIIPPCSERILILGSSGGIGRAIAHRYALRGAKICVVARRSAELDAVRSECEVLARAHERAHGHAHDLSSSEFSASSSVLSICGDITRAQDLISMRERLNEGESCVNDPSLDIGSHILVYFLFFIEWHGIDTLIIAAGVSALRPVLEIAGVKGPSVTEPSLDGVQRIEDAALAAIKGNYLAPLLSVVTFVRPLFYPTSTSSMTFNISDSSYAVHELLAIRSPRIVPRRRYSRAYSSNLRVDQGRFFYPLPSPFYRTSLCAFLACTSINRRRKLSSFGGGWWSGKRRKANSGWSQARRRCRALRTCDRWT
jgi:NAD(P)-dependent dehydrogenase (short-subunit alcohol dehydrogenase family)